MKKIFTILTIICVTACVSNQYYSEPLNYTYKDNIELQRIDIQYMNNTPRPICLGLEDWPNKLGEIDGGNAKVFIKINSNRYMMDYYNYSPYCIGFCRVKVAPGETITGFFKYSNFIDFTENLYASPKILEFSSQTTSCK